LIGVVAGHEQPTAAETADSFARLGELIDSWGTHAHTMLVLRRQTLPLVAGVQTYTVGLGGTLNVARPLRVEAAASVSTDTPPVEAPLAVLFDQAYIGQALKTHTGDVQAVYYTPTVPYGTLWVWPVPSAAETLALYWHEPIQQFPDLVTPVDLAPAYAKALRTNLAIELAPEFGRVVDPTVERLARESLADVKRANVALVEIGIDPALTGGGGGYDIRTDT